ncbi:BTAD domain-containing putative transcriptional regulator [Actinomadura rubrisoli]|uniref:BTAD domain-containing putative transcriptional regulator n=1 Tax=Actinomadura rubrisoli TaxID=2530368 RepID=UPI0014047DA1|nr:BTAD domain-containing putative transcriptional regulator [Actinomadura rubrisoli]
MADRPLRFEILGRLRAWRDGQELDLGPGKQRAVLAVLLLNAGRAVSTAAIVDAVWADQPPDNGANVVQKYVAGLRRVLEPERSPRSPGRLLTLTGAGYALHVPADGLDACVFHDHVREALAARASGPAEEAAARLRAALAMWRGPALDGIQGAVFDAARERLADERAGAAEAAAEIELELGRHAELVPELHRLVAEFPLREGLRHLLMLALYRCGRQAEALAAYRDTRAFLSEEFGVEPGERLQNLHVGILRGDPALAAPARAAAPTWAAVTPAQAPLPVPASARAPVQMRERPFDDALPAVPWTVAAPYGVPPTPRPWPLRLLAICAPVASVGLGTFALIAYFAARRRSPSLALASAGYLALMGVFLAIVLGTDENTTTWLDAPAFLSWFVAMFGGAVHIAVLTSAPPAEGHRTPPAVVDMIERRTRREQARMLLARHPKMASELRVGRPDLARDFDDGGLVDINAVPEHVLAALPGVDPYQAKLIATARGAGAFASPEDLIGRGVLPAAVVRALHETLIAVPPAEDAVENAVRE